MYIPLATLSRHSAFSSSAVDVPLLLAAAKRSPSLSVDEDALMIRPLVQARRNTLILRDLPEGCEEDELRELFKTCSEFKALESVKLDVNRTAFVAFETDEAAQDAALWLRSQKLRDEIIKCSIKTEQLNRGFYPASGPPSPAWGTMQSPYSTQQQQMWGGWSGYQQQQQYYQDMWHGDGQYYGYGYDSGYWNQGYGNGYDAGWYDGKGYDGKASDGKGGWSDGKASEGKGYDSKGGHSDEKSAKGKGGEAGKGFEEKGKGKGKGKKGGKWKGKDKDAAGDWGAAVAAAPSAGADLPSEAEDGASDDEGYTYEYRSYTRQQLIDICNSMDEIEKPESYAQLEEQSPDCANMFRKTACKDWAPLPTPFMGPRSNDFDLDVQGLAGGRPPRKGSNWSKSSQEDGWGNEKGGKGNWRRRTSSGWSDRWDDGEWDETNGKWSGGADGKKEKSESDKKGSRGKAAASRPTWVEKAKEGKNANGEADVGEKKDAPSSKEETSRTDAEASDAKDKEADTEKKPMSWADKVRAGKK